LADTAPARWAPAGPRVSALLLGVTWLEVAVLLVAGGGLLIAHPVVVGIWPWALAPFNGRFLGALYTAALVAAFLQAVAGRWAPARTVTLMIFVFTLVVTVCSVVHLNRFDPERPEVWVWFGLYVGVCLNAGAHLWIYRRCPLAGTRPSGRTRVVLLAQALFFGGHGLALLLWPAGAAALWPWKLDVFHAQLYSVAFLTPAVAAWSLARRSAPVDWLTQGLTQLAWGLLPLLALVLVDVRVHRVDWLAPTTWVWMACFGALAAFGVWMLGQRSGPAPGINP
jgi:hypothetical protein